MKVERSDVVLAVLGLAGLAVIFWALFRYHAYRDYADASCDAQGLPLAISMGTDWEDRVLFVERGAPYFLRLTLDAPPADVPAKAFVRDVAMRSVTSGEPLPLGRRAAHVTDTLRYEGGVVFALDDLRMPYVDYRVSGEVVYPEAGGERRFPFACPLRVAPSGEWRFVPWDMLLYIT
jgi:hypothetical protein